MYHAYVFIIFSVIASFSAWERNARHLHCVFSRYMFRVFELNERHFVLKYYKNNEGIFNKMNVKNYGMYLRTHGEIVLAMLDELRNNNSKVYPSDLMMVNLYLNNMSGNLNVFTPYSPNKDCKNCKHIQKYDKINLRLGYEVNHKMITATLLNFIYSSCHRVWFICHKLKLRFVPLQHLVNKSTKFLGETDVKKIGTHLEEMLSEVGAIFQQTINENKFKDFLPKHMLFYDIMSGLSKWSDAESASTSMVNDELNLMCDVVVISHVDNQVTEHTMCDLLEYMIMNFNAEFLKSYQQQVLAATLHPLFTCVHTYVKKFKQIFEDGLDNDKKTTTKHGNTLLNVINNGLEQFNVYPQNVEKYVLKVRDELNIIVNDVNGSTSRTKKQDSLSRVLNLCSKPMLLNRFKFENQENVNVAWSDIEQMIDKLNDFINRLLIYKEAFLIIKNTIDHSNMFQIRPKDCFQSTIVGCLFKSNKEKDLSCDKTNKVLEILDNMISNFDNKSTMSIEHDSENNEIQVIDENGPSSSNFSNKSIETRSKIKMNIVNESSKVASLNVHSSNRTNSDISNDTFTGIYNSDHEKLINKSSSSKDSFVKPLLKNIRCQNSGLLENLVEREHRYEIGPSKLKLKGIDQENDDEDKSDLCCSIGSTSESSIFVERRNIDNGFRTAVNTIESPEEFSSAREYFLDLDDISD